MTLLRSGDRRRDLGRLPTIYDQLGDPGTARAGVAPVRPPRIDRRGIDLYVRSRWSNWIPDSIPAWAQFFSERPMQLAPGDAPQSVLDTCWANGGSLVSLPDNPVGQIYGPPFERGFGSILASFPAYDEHGNYIGVRRTLSYHAIVVPDDFIAVPRT